MVENKSWLVIYPPLSMTNGTELNNTAKLVGLSTHKPGDLAYDVPTLQQRVGSSHQELADSETVAAEMERLWAGVVDWAVANKVGLEARCRYPFA